MQTHHSTLWAREGPTCENKDPYQSLLLIITGYQPCALQMAPETGRMMLRVRAAPSSGRWHVWSSCRFLPCDLKQKKKSSLRWVSAVNSAGCQQQWGTISRHAIPTVSWPTHVSKLRASSAWNHCLALKDWKNRKLFQRCLRIWCWRLNFPFISLQHFRPGALSRHCEVVIYF